MVRNFLLNSLTSIESSWKAWKGNSLETLPRERRQRPILLGALRDPSRLKDEDTGSLRPSRENLLPPGTIPAFRIPLKDSEEAPMASSGKVSGSRGREDCLYGTEKGPIAQGADGPLLKRFHGREDKAKQEVPQGGCLTEQGAIHE